MRPVVVAVIAAQVVLPVSMLVTRWVDDGSRAASERPASWQMYSYVPAAAYAGRDAVGHRRPLDVRGLPFLLRAVDTGRVVPDRLCDRDPDLVVVERTGGTQPGEFRC